MTRRAPRGLGASGRAFWRRILEVYELSPPELLLLEEACRTADLIESLQTSIAGRAEQGAMFGGDADTVPRAVREIRHQRQTLARLLSQIDLPGPDKIESPATIRARKAAQARWRRREDDPRVIVGER